MRIGKVVTVLVLALGACGGGARGPRDDSPVLPEPLDSQDLVVEVGASDPDVGDPATSPDPAEPTDGIEAPAVPDPSEVFDWSDPADPGNWPDVAPDVGLADASHDPEPPDLPDEVDAFDTQSPDDTPGPPDPGDAPDWQDEADAPGPVDLPRPPVDPGAPPVPYVCWSDSFEWDADFGWEATGLWHRIHADQDLVDVWASAPYHYVSLAGPATLTKPKDGKYAFWYGRDENGSYLGTPDANQVAGGGTSSEPHEGALVSPWVDLTGAASATLFFWSWWEIESQHPAGYDLSTVEVTADGDTWTEVARLNPPVVPPGANPVLPYTVNGVGMPPSWHRTVASLDAVAGGPARIRFRFRTGDVFFNAFRGWVLDEVSVECVAPMGAMSGSQGRAVGDGTSRGRNPGRDSEADTDTTTVTDAVTDTATAHGHGPARVAPARSCASRRSRPHGRFFGELGRLDPKK